MTSKGKLVTSTEAEIQKILGVSISPSLTYSIPNNYSKRVSGLDHTYSSDTYAYLYTYGTGNKTKLNIGIFLYTYAGFWYNSETNGGNSKSANIVVYTDSSLSTVNSLSGFTTIGQCASVNSNNDRIRGNAYATILFLKP